MEQRELLLLDLRQIIAIKMSNDVLNTQGGPETELVMAYHSELVHKEKINPKGAVNLHRLEHMSGIRTPVSWYCDHPTHQEGDPSTADAEIGRKKFKIAAKYVAEQIKKIKQDNEAPRILKEYYDSWGSWL